MFLEKVVLKICSKPTGEHPRRSAISIKLQSNFTEIALRHGCSPVNLLHIFRTSFLKNTSGRLLLFVLSLFLFSAFCLAVLEKFVLLKNNSFCSFCFSYIIISILLSVFFNLSSQMKKQPPKVLYKKSCS